jgi:hypothetical protein
MPVLNHSIVATRDKEATARYFSEILGLPQAVKLGKFAVLNVSNDTTLDFRDSATDDFDRLHYAFPVTEAEFDEIFERIKVREIDYWSDPMHEDAGHTNRSHARRRRPHEPVNGHRLEIITGSYGSGGTEAAHPHPLVAPTIENDDRSDGPLRRCGGNVKRLTARAWIYEIVGPTASASMGSSTCRDMATT